MGGGTSLSRVHFRTTWGFPRPLPAGFPGGGVGGGQTLVLEAPEQQVEACLWLLSLFQFQGGLLTRLVGSSTSLLGPAVGLGLEGRPERPGRRSHTLQKPTLDDLSPCKES